MGLLMIPKTLSFYVEKLSSNSLQGRVNCYLNRANRITSTGGTPQRSGALCRFGVALWLCEFGDCGPDAVPVAKEWDGGGSDRHHRRDSTSAYGLVFPLVASRGCRVQATFLGPRLRARRRCG